MCSNCIILCTRLCKGQRSCGNMHNLQDRVMNLGTYSSSQGSSKYMQCCSDVVKIECQAHTYIFIRSTLLRQQYVYMKQHYQSLNSTWHEDDYRHILIKQSLFNVMQGNLVITCSLRYLILKGNFAGPNTLFFIVFLAPT